MKAGANVNEADNAGKQRDDAVLVLLSLTEISLSRLQDGPRCMKVRFVRLDGLLRLKFIIVAVTKNQFKAARLLLKSGAHSNAPGPEGQTPLVDAVLNNNTKVNSA